MLRSSPAAHRASARRRLASWRKRGAKVAIFDRDVEKGEKVAAEIGGVFCEVDVTSDEKVAAAFAKAREAHGQERVLVNCAGVANAAKTVGRDKETKAAEALPDDRSSSWPSRST